MKKKKKEGKGYKKNEVASDTATSKVASELMALLAAVSEASQSHSYESRK